MSPTLRFQSTLLVLSRLVRMIPYSSFTRLAPPDFPSQFRKLTRLYCNGAKVVSKRLKRCYNAILVTILKYIFFPAVVSGYRGTGIGQGGAMLPSFHTMGIFRGRRTKWKCICLQYIRQKNAETHGRHADLLSGAQNNLIVQAPDDLEQHRVLRVAHDYIPRRESFLPIDLAVGCVDVVMCVILKQ